jgi:hypothetical protein
MDKRAGGRAFYGFGGSYRNYPLIYKKALTSDYMPSYYLPAYKRAGGRAFSGFVSLPLEDEDRRQKRAGGRSFPVFLDESAEKRMAPVI